MNECVHCCHCCWCAAWLQSIVVAHVLCVNVILSSVFNHWQWSSHGICVWCCFVCGCDNCMTTRMVSAHGWVSQHFSVYCWTWLYVTSLCCVCVKLSSFQFLFSMSCSLSFAQFARFRLALKQWFWLLCAPWWILQKSSLCSMHSICGILIFADLMWWHHRLTSVSANTTRRGFGNPVACCERLCEPRPFHSDHYVCIALFWWLPNAHCLQKLHR